MDLSEIASISGKPGLYQIVKPARHGVLVESLDAKKSRFVANLHHKVSVLKDISIYTTTQEGSVPLEDVMTKIHGEFEGDPGVDSKSDGDELRAFLKHIVPDYDEEKVYTSDIKKLINWYVLLCKELPQIFEENEATEEVKAEEAETTSEGQEPEPEATNSSEEEK